MSDEGWRFALARRIRTAAGVPVAVVGSRRPERAEAAIRDGYTDLIALGRPLLADPHWATKARAGDDAAIRLCTSCNWCADQVFRHEPTGCAENPRAGRESVALLPPDVGAGRRVVVVGGGPGGLAAAVQARSVGFAVTLLEARPELGGGLRASAAPPNKDSLLWYRDYLVRRVAESGVDVRCGTPVTSEQVLALDPYAVIHAQGASPVHHGLPGELLPHVHPAYDLLVGDGPAPEDRRGPVLVYGGGETGCETAELMAEHGLEVLLVSRSGERELARAAEPLYRKTLLRRLRANARITLVTDTHLVEIGERDVVLETAGSTTRREIAMVLLAQGRRRNDAMHAALTERGVRSVVIGDARQIGRIGDAVHQANGAVRDIVGSDAEPPPA
jgi:NADPH-dependent 2,4-dienoyl-CoA reductase/sulfur reductase-like enzyme